MLFRSHDSVAELTPESSESRTTGGVIVKVALDYSIVSQQGYGFCDIGNGIKHNTVVAVVEAEAFSRKEVDETLEDIAPGITVGNTGNMLRRTRTLKERIAKFIAAGVVLESDGIILFAVQLIIDLHAVSLGNVSRNISIGEIF